MESFNKRDKMEKQLTTKQLMLWIGIAYLFSVLIRMIWVYQVHGIPSFYWNGQLMINTNDGYFFASGVQKELFGMHMHNPRVYGIWDYGVIFFTTLFAKITPFSLETIILYMPSLISSLVVIPIILIANLYNKPFWGFFSALLGSIAWSYYNRTMTGYYDTDMFSAMAPMFILYFLMKSTHDFNLKSALYASVAIVLYPFLYDQGLAIVYAMGMIYGAYMVWYHRNSKTTYASLLLVFLALLPLGLDAPLKYIVHLILIAVVYAILNQKEFQQKKLMIASGMVFGLFLIFGNVVGLIIAKVFSYTITGTEQEAGLHFYAVNQTVREAGHISFSTFANRISGSIVGLIISAIGYIILVLQYRTFLLALPLVGIGIFANWGGLRFTVYAVPIAAMSAIYFFYIIFDNLLKKESNDKLKINIQTQKNILVAIATIAVLYPNIKHIIRYQVPTVFNNSEVKELVQLNKFSNDKDYTLTWWDYGYPIWYYSDTNTLIDGGKHNNDNYIISKIMQTTSPTLAANLSRLAVETYVDNNYSVVANKLFEGKDPNEVLTNLDNPTFKLPPKSRDIYLYMPYRMLDIFPTITLFGNLDLSTGKKERNIVFYPTRVKSKTDGKLLFRNGIIFDLKEGTLAIGKNKHKIKDFIITDNKKNGDIQIGGKQYYKNSDLYVVYMRSYNRFVIMDKEIFKSMYVQMFILGRYDKRYFEPVVKSIYVRISR
jgi:dolichyl-diphosphooligosaccharide--protein glycosyltransferase/undecaprenyl-diphosphooligosaccharide--protein glycosyltransferase